MRRLLLNCAAAAALVMNAAPVVAVPAATASAAAQSRVLPISIEVARFYRSRGNAPIWFARSETSSAASSIVDILRGAHFGGLSNGPELAAQAERAIASARSGSPAAIARAEHLLSAAWVTYVQALKSPTTVMEYGDELRTPKIPAPQQILYQAAAARSLQEHVQAVSDVNPIYSELRDAASELERSGEADPETLRRLLANLERARVLPSRGRFVLVDVASGRLSMYEDGQLQDSMRIIVGKPNPIDQTPLIASTIYYATLKPYWHVPPSLVRKLTAPNVLRKGFGYLRSRGYQVVSAYTANPRIIPPHTVDWHAVAAGRNEVGVRQLPGPANSMGDMKVSFPNSSAIYLHDTPLKSLFDKPQHTLSAGCIRLEDAPRFGRWLLGREPVASGAPEQHVQLPAEVPIYVTYLTARVEGDQLTFLDDVYGLDARRPSSPVAGE